jgi:hypothetical protein
MKYKHYMLIVKIAIFGAMAFFLFKVFEPRFYGIEPKEGELYLHSYNYIGDAPLMPAVIDTIRIVKIEKGIATYFHFRTGYEFESNLIFLKTNLREIPCK